MSSRYGFWNGLLLISNNDVWGRKYLDLNEKLYRVKSARSIS